MDADTRPDQTTALPVELEQLSRHFIRAFPVMDKSQQQLALTLYRLLAQGKPVSIAQLTEAVEHPVGVIDQTLRTWPGVFYNDDHNVIGFWGITIQETLNQMVVDNVAVYAWCAWDALFIPTLLNTSAEVTSHCAVTDDEIKLSITPQGIESSSHNDIAISFLIPDENELKENITNSFCCHVFFFHSRQVGEHWATEHPGIFLLSLDEAYVVGKKMNAIRYNLTLK